MSDLHTDITRYTYDYDLNADVIIVAGDSKEGGDIYSLQPYVANEKLVIYVPGNHEYYNHEINETRTVMKRAATTCGVKVLDRDYIIHNGVRYVGCTLWTDFNLMNNAHTAKLVANMYMNDYVLIKYSDGWDTENFSPDISQELHYGDVAWLESVLNEYFDGPTVVVTHHGPTILSVSEKYRNSDAATTQLNASYASDLSKLIDKYNPKLWIHGHTHDPKDYEIFNTRVICNPRGYAYRGENPNWVPKIIEV